MIKLYGSPQSNHYTMLLMALTEKGFDFETLPMLAAQTSNDLRLAIGKAPYIEVKEGFLSGTLPVLEFLEDIQPDIPLFPEGDYERGKCRELMKVVELCIDLPARAVTIPMLLKEPVSESVLEKAEKDIKQGLDSIAQLTDFDGYLIQNTFSYADILLFGAINFAFTKECGLDSWCSLGGYRGLFAWYEAVSERHSVKTAKAAYDKALSVSTSLFK